MNKATRTTLGALGRWGLSILILTLGIAFGIYAGESQVFSATTANVTVTATPSWVDISNLPIEFDFGLVTASSTPNTGTGYFTVTDSSSVNVTATIVCNGWSGTSSWTYGAPGEDQGLLNASDNDGAYDVEVDDTTPIALHTTTTPGTDWDWELQLEAPSSFTHIYQQTTIVTLSASGA